MMEIWDPILDVPDQNRPESEPEDDLDIFDNFETDQKEDEGKIKAKCGYTSDFIDEGYAVPQITWKNEPIWELRWGYLSINFPRNKVPGPFKRWLMSKLLGTEWIYH